MVKYFKELLSEIKRIREIQESQLSLIKEIADCTSLARMRTGSRERNCIYVKGHKEGTI